VPVVKSIFALFQVQVESLMRDTIELLQAPHSGTPEAFNAVHICRVAHEHIIPMIDSEVIRVADINQSVVAAPSVRVGDSFGSYN
jgi:hypothetical protein